MASAVSVFRKFRSSDGRIKIATLFGGSVLVAVIALLVGILPVFASNPEAVPLDEGGGDGKCFVETGGLPSAAGNEFHLANAKEADSPYFAAGGDIRIDVYDVAAGTVFDFEVVNGNWVVYDVTVNGGPKTLHYDYDAYEDPVKFDEELHAPNQTPNKYHNLSHINLCWDIPGLAIEECDDVAIREEGDGDLKIVDLQIFQNRLYDCTNKQVLFTIVGDTATVEFQGDGSDTVAGRLDFYKELGDGPSLVPLQYDGPGPFVDLQWCNVDDKVEVEDADPVTGLFDGDEFDDELGPDRYPNLVDVKDNNGIELVDATACKVFEEENADGDQHTVVYFEFVDPNFQ